MREDYLPQMKDEMIIISKKEVDENADKEYVECDDAETNRKFETKAAKPTKVEEKAYKKYGEEKAYK
eukprot:466175-Heterocapsa_arctica.AAC.1